MKRRSFLKLLAMTLGSAGVTARTIGSVFGEEVERGEEVDKWQCVKALRKIIERYNAASSEDEQMRHSLDALRIMAEAHRDVSGVWAGGCVSLWVNATGALTQLIKSARANRNDPLIGAMLSKFKDKLLSGKKRTDEQEISACIFLIEADLAFHEMEGRTRQEGFAWQAERDFSSIGYQFDRLKQLAPDKLQELYGVPANQIFSGTSHHS